MLHGKKISVVFATYREKASIRNVITEFEETGIVDEIVVVNNNAEPGTDEEVKKTKARLVYQTKQGYGWALRKGIKEATGDYIVLCEPDYTYAGKDIWKFLAYAEDFDIVFGSRTNRATVALNTDMNVLRRIGNVFYAKVIEVLYGAKTITDIGCTYKLFRKEALRMIEPYFSSGDPKFATELILLAASFKIPFVEIPVNYRSRVGESTIISHWYKLIRWAFKLMWFFFSFRAKWALGRIRANHYNV
ncbi:MAG: glycosyltransferase family 2 protein [Parcubacteria group bacterium]|nr:glycosyltransferase family 2 protein [Parcubacteria group bacterium]